MLTIPLHRNRRKGKAVTGILTIVLVAFGEALTFSGSVMGIDYHYRNKKE